MVGPINLNQVISQIPQVAEALAPGQQAAEVAQRQAQLEQDAKFRLQHETVRKMEQIEPAGSVDKKKERDKKRRRPIAPNGTAAEVDIEGASPEGRVINVVI